MTKTKQQKRKRKLSPRAVWALLLALAALAAAAVLLLKDDPASPRGRSRLLTLVNPWNPMAEGYVPKLTSIGDGHYVDSRCADALTKMLEDCRAAGLTPVICSSYRDQATQQALFDDKVSRVMAEQGCSEAEAKEIAATVVAVPGTSEHQLGLAVDIVDASYMQLDAAQEQTAVQQWLMQHCAEYGFILRYPTGKSALTGIIYEPWHYRYVGKEAAQEMTAAGKCLEEYLAFR